ncbi:hypothetical protein FOL47_010058 [Perkinsus chesapeaki]|uniref:Uncharacterized protein n=1 Tax=Perkinsus chesapeaki TaxID=330153 RepID=A0A7J6MQC5_PERCH|nr:hypothetical protein FOL47_010058 [Perkinsus chesapeaki]
MKPLLLSVPAWHFTAASVFPNPSEVFHHMDEVFNANHLFGTGFSSPLDDILHAAGFLHQLLPADHAVMLHQPRPFLRTSHAVPDAFHHALSQMMAASMGPSGGFHVNATNTSVVITGTLPGHALVDEAGEGSTVSVKKYGHGLVVRASTEHDGIKRLMQRFYHLGDDYNLDKTNVTFDKTSGRLRIEVLRKRNGIMKGSALPAHHKKALEAAVVDAHSNSKVRVLFGDDNNAHVFVPEDSGGIRSLEGTRFVLNNGEVVQLPVAVEKVLEERRDDNSGHGMVQYVLKTVEAFEDLPISEEL